MTITSTHAKLALGLVLVASALSLSGCSALGNLLSPDTEQRDDEGTIVDGGTTDVFTLKIGDCLTEFGEGETVSDVPTVPCDQAHSDEIYAEVSMDPGAFPSEDAIIAKGDEYCVGAFDAFAGIAYADSTLDYSYYYPTEDSWTTLDDRLISCVIYDPNNTALTGTLAGAAR